MIAVFDRDEHRTYIQALQQADRLNNRLANDERRRIPFQAVASVPCFELWLLLHFEDVQAPVHRDMVYERLKAHLPEYDKGQSGHWAQTKGHLAIASAHAEARAESTTAHSGYETYTGMHKLVSLRLHLKDPI